MEKLFITVFSLKLLRSEAIVHLESFNLTRKSQWRLRIEITHASIAAMCLHTFICIGVRLRVLFATDRVRIIIRARRELHLKSMRRYIIIFISLVIGSHKRALFAPSSQYSAASAELEGTFVHRELFDNRIQSAGTKLYKLCPCCAGYVIDTNAMTLVPTQEIYSETTITNGNNASI